MRYETTVEFEDKYGRVFECDARVEYEYHPPNGTESELDYHGYLAITYLDLERAYITLLNETLVCVDPLHVENLHYHKIFQMVEDKMMEERPWED